MSFPSFDPSQDLLILEKLSFLDIQKVGIVNNYLKDLGNSSELWMKKIKEDYPTLYLNVLQEYSPKERYEKLWHAFDEFHQIIEVTVDDSDVDQIRINKTSDISLVISYLEEKEGNNIVSLGLEKETPDSFLLKQITYNLSTREITDVTPSSEPGKEVSPESLIVGSFMAVD